jgi:uncharacterized delta-60 repeat protein
MALKEKIRTRLMFAVSGLVLAATVAGMAGGTAASAAGLDPSFGSSGLARTDFAGANDTVGAVLVQSDGRIVIAGTSQTATGSRCVIVRHLASGALDASFGAGGRVTLFDLSSSVICHAASLAQQADGKILVGGGLQTNAPLVVRLNTNGTIDGSFGAGGYQLFPNYVNGGSSTGPNTINKMLVLGNGKIWAMGAALLFPDDFANFAILSVLDSAGQIDPVSGPFDVRTLGSIAGFGLYIDFSIISDAAEVGPNIVVAGGAGEDGAGLVSDLLVARFNTATAQYDPTFGSGGITRIRAARGERFTTLAVLPDGRLLGAGVNFYVTPQFAQPLQMRRFSANGALDTSFVQPAMMVTDSPLLAAAPGGGLYLGTTVNLGTAQNFQLSRIGVNGVADAAFGSIQVNFGQQDQLRAMAVQADGRIVLAGSAVTNTASSSNSDLGVARIDPAAGGTPPPVTVPAAPSGFTIARTSSTSLTLRWTDNASNETGYVIERSATAAFATVTTVATTAASVTSFVNTGLARNTTYYYRITARNAAGSSAAVTASAATLAK